MVLALATMVGAAALVAAQTTASTGSQSSVSTGSISASGQAAIDGTTDIVDAGAVINGSLDTDIRYPHETDESRREAREATNIGTTVRSTYEGVVDIAASVDIHARTASLVDELEAWCVAHSAHYADIGADSSLGAADASGSADLSGLCTQASALIDDAGTSLVAASEGCNVPSSGSGADSGDASGDGSGQSEDKSDEEDEPNGNAATRAAKRVWGAVRGIFS